jgi:hypothetical protein
MIMGDGTIFAVGSEGGYIGVASYNSNGSLNTAFGTGGTFFDYSLQGIGFGIIPTTFSISPTPTPTPTSPPVAVPNIRGWSPSTDVPVESWKDRQSRLLNWPRLRKVLIKVQDQDPYKLAHDTLIDYEDNTTHPI